jgi:hypothetical protein
VVDNKLIIEALPSIKELLRQPPVVQTTIRRIEKISETIQKEKGIYE